MKHSSLPPGHSGFEEVKRGVIAAGTPMGAQHHAECSFWGAGPPPTLAGPKGQGLGFTGSGAKPDHASEFVTHPDPKTRGATHVAPQLRGVMLGVARGSHPGAAPPATWGHLEVPSRLQRSPQWPGRDCPRRCPLRLLGLRGWSQCCPQRGGTSAPASTPPHCPQPGSCVPEVAPTCLCVSHGSVSQVFPRTCSLCYLSLLCLLRVPSCVPHVACAPSPT